MHTTSIVSIIAALAAGASAQQTTASRTQAPAASPTPSPLTIFLGEYTGGPPAIWYDYGTVGTRFAGCLYAVGLLTNSTNDPCTLNNGQIMLDFGEVTMEGCGGPYLSVQTPYGNFPCVYDGNKQTDSCSDLTYGWTCAAGYPSGGA